MDDIATVRETLEEFRVELIAQGGDVKVAAVDEDTVLLTLSGPFTAHCTEKRMVVGHLERVLKARLPWIERVETVCPEVGPEAR
jgi:Fe-S cluster biogenesis protein NfuA